MEAYVPKKVADEIKKHLRSAGKKAEVGWKSASADEDTLTGDFGAVLRQDFHWSHDGNGKVWGWGVNYSKFGGRGEGAPERTIGADGIFEITLHLRGTKEVFQKGLLFQSKKAGNTKLAELKEQGQKMEALAPEGSCVLEFGPNAYRACDTDDVVSANKLSSAIANASQIGDYLAGRFFTCKIGKMGMYFDGGRQTLVLPDKVKGLRKIRAAIKHRMDITIVKSD